MVKKNQNLSKDTIWCPGAGQSGEHPPLFCSAGANKAAVVVFDQGSNCPPPQKIYPPQNQTSSKTNFFLQLRPEDDDESDHNLTPILERKSGRQPFTKKDTVLQLELQFENEMRKSHYH